MSFASVLMMVFTLFVIGLAMFTGVILSTTLQQFRDKADMNVYFTTDAPVSQIMSVEASLNALPQVASVTYISSDDALAQFRERHANDQLTLQGARRARRQPARSGSSMCRPKTSRSMTSSPTICRGRMRSPPARRS